MIRGRGRWRERRWQSCLGEVTAGGGWKEKTNPRGGKEGRWGCSIYCVYNNYKLTTATTTLSHFPLTICTHTHTHNHLLNFSLVLGRWPVVILRHNPSFQVFVVFSYPLPQLYLLCLFSRVKIRIWRCVSKGRVPYHQKGIVDKGRKALQSSHHVSYHNLGHGNSIHSSKTASIVQRRAFFYLNRRITLMKREINQLFKPISSSGCWRIKKQENGPGVLHG